jgi:hypothetical protein
MYIVLSGHEDPGLPPVTDFAPGRNPTHHVMRISTRLLLNFACLVLLERRRARGDLYRHLASSLAYPY